jgi:hypothetical protein
MGENFGSLQPDKSEVLKKKIKHPKKGLVKQDHFIIGMKK